MEKSEIKKLVSRLRMEYVAVWLLSLGIPFLYETGILDEGALAHDGQVCYVVQTLTVLLTLCLIPASLKWYSMALNQSLEDVPMQDVVKRYCRWNEVRLALLAVVALVGLSVYYVTLSSIGGLCALLGLTATLFCLPTEQRVKGELEIFEKKETDEEIDDCHC